MSKKKVEKQKAPTVEQSRPLRAWKGSTEEQTEAEEFCLEKRWLGREREMAIFSLGITINRTL